MVEDPDSSRRPTRRVRKRLTKQDKAKLMPRLGIFICYAHCDDRWRARLQVHLSPLARQLGIQPWDDRKIQGGALWRAELEAAIATAGVAIMLVTADFISSQFIAEKELPPLLDAVADEGVLILPVIVSASMYTKLPELSRYQAVNDPSRPLVTLTRGKQEAVLADVAERVRAHFNL